MDVSVDCTTKGAFERKIAAVIFCNSRSRRERGAGAIRRRFWWSSAVPLSGKLDTALGSSSESMRDALWAACVGMELFSLRFSIAILSRFRVAAHCSNVWSASFFSRSVTDYG
jgi:hypothetical protein